MESANAWRQAAEETESRLMQRTAALSAAPATQALNQQHQQQQPRAPHSITAPYVPPSISGSGGGGAVQWTPGDVSSPPSLAPPVSAALASLPHGKITSDSVKDRDRDSWRLAKMSGAVAEIGVAIGGGVQNRAAKGGGLSVVNGRVVAPASPPAISSPRNLKSTATRGTEARASQGRTHGGSGNISSLRGEVHQEAQSKSHDEAHEKAHRLAGKAHQEAQDKAQHVADLYLKVQGLRAQVCMLGSRD
jgi:hypothetical protein